MEIRPRTTRSPTRVDTPGYIGYHDNMTDTVQVTYRLDRAMFEAIRRRALAEGTSASEIVRRSFAVRETLLDATDELPRSGKRTAKVAVLPEDVPYPEGAIGMRLHVTDTRPREALDA